MLINLSYVSERDMDLLFIQEISSSEKFLSFILDKINLVGFKNIDSVSHSLMHLTLGESDIVVILNMENHKHAILIENKIDALAMVNQSSRYQLRAEEAIKKGEYDDCSIMIFAPKRYLESNVEAGKYPNQLSYEEILEYLKTNGTQSKAYKTHLLKMAIEKEKAGYVPQADEKVTLFWQKYYSYKNQHFPHLILNEIEGPRGSKARWPWFGTLSKTMAIAHKSNKGYVDLTLHGQANELVILEEKLNPILEPNMSIVITKKSTSIRIIVPKVDFELEFDNQIKEVNEALEQVSKLYELSKKIIKENH